MKRADMLIALTLVALVAGCGGKPKEQQSSTTTEQSSQTTTQTETSTSTAARDTTGADTAAAKTPADTGATTPTAASGKEVTTPSGLKYVDLKVGTGPSPQPGQIVTVHYTGWLTNGTKFDSSKDRGTPFEFAIGTGRVIKGWDEGVMSMKVGGVRKLVIPPQLAYGPQAMGPIPANSTLVFEVELLGVK